MEFTADPARIEDGDFVVVAVLTPIDSHNNPDLTLVVGASFRWDNRIDSKEI